MEFSVTNLTITVSNKVFAKVLLGSIEIDEVLLRFMAFARVGEANIKAHLRARTVE